MFRIVCTRDNIKYTKRTLRGEGHFRKMPYELRDYILFFEPKMENENEVALLLINLVDRGFVLKFVYWNELRGKEQDQEEANERAFASDSSGGDSVVSDRAE